MSCISEHHKKKEKTNVKLQYKPQSWDGTSWEAGITAELAPTKAGEGVTFMTCLLR